MQNNSLLKQRRKLLERICNGEILDSILTAGGWITSAEYIRKLANCSKDEFWSNPEKYTAQAYKNLGVDILIDMHIPTSESEFRVATFTDDEKKDIAPENVEKFIDNLPESEQLMDEFDFAKEYERYIRDFQVRQELISPIIWAPAQWDAVARFQWYEDFGYENFLIASKLYEDKIDRLFEYAGVKARLRAEIIARAISEYNHPRLILTGVDICTCKAPLVSPEYLRVHYWKWARYSLEPLFNAGAKIIWHCDGNIMPIIDDIISLGVAGLQGFQSECGVFLKDVIDRYKTVNNASPIILGAISVVDTLPKVTSECISDAVHQCRDICAQTGANLILFTSNTIGPEVPLENIITMYKSAKSN